MALPSNDNAINRLCSQFQQAWEQGSRPWISDYIEHLDRADRRGLITALIPIDIECRILRGDIPRANDYMQFGPEAVAVARQDLQESFESFETSKNPEATAVNDPSLLHSRSQEFLFDSVIGESHGGDSHPGMAAESIGPYELLQKIGEGGMGTVWLAQQEHPVKRRVALKVIRRDRATKGLVARFEAERQAIAMMDHQNIAKILDAGKTPQGNPYFVMELVKGIPLNKFCDKKRLNIRQRLELMVPICRAVQHAHQKGIIHRDLKHSNVLVTQYDGKPVPKIIDFGLAKPLEHHKKLTDKTMVTEFGRVVGTVQYMSPEQAEMSNVDIDTRSDIYSLGVMIFKLLTGSTPIPMQEVKDMSLIDVLQKIRDEDAPRPSERIRERDPASVAKLCGLRQTQPEKFAQILRGDLDWIVMKSLEKDRNRRYETANGLAMEIERFLNHEKVLARPPSTWYGIQKFVRRNRGWVASMVVTSLMLIAGIVATSTASIWALSERDRANENAIQARDEAHNALLAEQKARKSEARATRLQANAEMQLHAIRMKSAWSDWQLGNVEHAWDMVNQLADDQRGWETRFLQTEFTASDSVLYGHARHVVSVDTSKDGRYFASAAQDDTVKIWNADQQQLVHTFLISEAATCVRFAPDSKTVACADRSNRVTIWDVESGKKINELGPYSRDVLTIAYTPDGKRLFAGTAESESFRVTRQRRYKDHGKPAIYLIDLADNQILETIFGHSRDITGVDCSNDGRWLVSSSMDRTAILWQVNEQNVQVKHKLEAHMSGLSGAVFSPSNEWVATASHDKTVRLWQVSTGSSILTLVGHTDLVNSVAFSPDGKSIVSSSTDRSSIVWDLKGSQLLTCQGHFSTLNDATFSHDGASILTASGDTTIRIWNSLSKPGTTITKAHSDIVWSADFSPDGTLVASASEDGSVALIDVQTGKQVGEKLELQSSVLSLDYSPVSPIIATAGADAKLRIWNTRNNSLVKLIDAHEDYIWDVKFSPDGKQIVTASSDRTVKIWSTFDWSLVTTISGHTSEMASARFSRDGKFLVTGSDDRSIKLWETGNYTLVKDFIGHSNAVWKALFSVDGNRLISSSYDGEIIVWDIRSGKIERRINAHYNQIAGLTLTDDGTRIVSASDDGTIKIWDIESGFELFVLRDRGDSPIVHVSFSPDGTKLLSGNGGGWVTIRSTKNLGTNAKTFLPQKSVELTMQGLVQLTSNYKEHADYKRELSIAEQCCRYFPSYETFTNRGIAEYRLGMFSQAIESLEEARRLEKIQYGEPDLRPNIEAFLAMSYFRTGNKNQSTSVYKEFEAKSQASLWRDDEQVKKLVVEVDNTFLGADK